MSQFNVIDATFQIRKSRRLLFCGCLGGRHEMSNIRQGKVIYEAIYEGVGPPSSNCSLGSRIFYLLFFQSELVAYWVKIEFGAHQKRPYDIVSNRTVQTSRCSLSSCNSHSAGMAAFRIDLSSVQQKTRIQIILLLVLPSSICVLHLPMLLDSLQLAISTSPR